MLWINIKHSLMNPALPIAPPTLSAHQYLSSTRFAVHDQLGKKG